MTKFHFSPIFDDTLFTYMVIKSKVTLDDPILEKREIYQIINHNKKIKFLAWTLPPHTLNTNVSGKLNTGGHCLDIKGINFKFLSVDFLSKL